MNILIVDDSLTARLFSKKCLMMCVGSEATFCEAANGQEALEQLEKQHVDAVLCDVNMPIMSGFTFLRNVKASEKWKDIPVIFVTSMANEARINNLIQLGAFDVVSKPVKPSKLKAVFDRLLKGDADDGSADEGWG